MTGESITYVIAFALVSLVLLSIYRRREGIRHRLRSVLRVELAYLIVAFLLVKAGQSPVVAILAGFVCALLVDRSAPGRRRYIPKSERRKAIARFELTGRKFNPRVHDLDHVIPFSKGGSSTADNLRVTERRKNRAKGAKSPWWDLLGR